MTPQQVITTARAIYNDADSTLYRMADTTLLAYVNDGLLEISGLRPQLFYTIGDVACTAGDVEQAVTFTDAQVLVEVLCIHGGAAIHYADIKAMDLFNPGWRTDTAAAATNWMRKEGDPLRFFVYPKAPSNQTVDILYVRNPTTLALNDTITEIPAGYQPALIDYVVYRAESSDDEHMVSQRATSHYQAFVAKVKG